jgi:hypothetical protein
MDQRVIEDVLMRQQTAQTDLLPSWNEGSSKRSILHFVEAVTSAGGEEFVPTNSMLSIFSEEEVHDVVVVLGEPSLDRYEITYARFPGWRDARERRCMRSDRCG